MPCVNCVERWRYDEVVKECEKLRNTNALFRAAYEEKRSQAQKYFEQATKLQRDRNMAEDRYGKAKELLRKRDAELKELCKENENMSNKYAKQVEHYQNLWRDALYEIRTRNSILQILFLATGISEEMLQELFNYVPLNKFSVCECRPSRPAVECAIKHCIETNGTIIDTITGLHFDIAERLRQAVQVRNWDGTPKPTLVVKPTPEPDVAQPMSQPVVKPTAKRCKAEGKEEGAPRPTNARCRNKRKKKDVRAKPEQSE